MTQLQNDKLSSSGYKATPKKYNLYERNMRKRIVLIFIPFILAIVTYFISTFDVWTYSFTFQLKITFVILLTISAFIALFTYLQTGFKTKITTNNFQIHNDLLLDKIEDYEDSIDSLKNKIVLLDTELQILKEERQKVEGISITKEEKETILTRIQSKIENESIEAVSANIESKIRESLEYVEVTDLLATGFNNIRGRLTKEINDLNRRGNVNLVLGIFVTLAGIILLYHFVYESKTEHTSILDFIMYFFPKIALVIFIETFAYFFLSLYKVSLNEIKYYQNELTKIDLNNISLLAAINLKSEHTATDILKIMSTPKDKIDRKDASEELESSKIDQKIKESVSVIFDKGLEELKK